MCIWYCLISTVGSCWHIVITCAPTGLCVTSRLSISRITGRVVDWMRLNVLQHGVCDQQAVMVTPNCNTSPNVTWWSFYIGASVRAILGEACSLWMLLLSLLLGCGEDTTLHTCCCIDASCDMTSVRYVVAIRPRSGSRWEHSTLVMSGLCRRFPWKTRRCLANTCEWTCCHTSAVNTSVHSPYSGHSLQHCYVTAESNSHHGDIAFVSDRPWRSW